MKTAVRYYTRTGNTEKLAHAIAKAAGVEAMSVASPLEEKVDILFLGSAVYAAGVDEAVKQFIADNHDKIGKIVNFSTAALLKSTYGQIKKLAEQSGVEMAEEEFHCRGAFSFMHKGRPDVDDLQQAAVFTKAVIDG